MDWLLTKESEPIFIGVGVVEDDFGLLDCEIRMVPSVGIDGRVRIEHCRDGPFGERPYLEPWDSKARRGEQIHSETRSKVALERFREGRTRF